MTPRLILFDVDGTLIDTAGAGRRAMVRAFHEVFGVDGMDARAAGVPFAGMTDLGIFADLAAAAGIEDGRYRAALDRLQSRYVAALRVEMERRDDRRRTLPGIPALLDTLAGREDARLGLLTGNLEPGARVKLEPFGLNGYFPGGGFGSDHPDRRQVARMAREKMSRLLDVRFDGDDVVVVGDTESDVDCARANGFRAVAVASGWGSLETLAAAGPDHLLADLGDRAAALAAFGLD